MPSAVAAASRCAPILPTCPPNPPRPNSGAGRSPLTIAVTCSTTLACNASACAWVNLPSVTAWAISAFSSATIASITFCTATFFDAATSANDEPSASAVFNSSEVMPSAVAAASRCAPILLPRPSPPSCIGRIADTVLSTAEFWTATFWTAAFRIVRAEPPIRADATPVNATPSAVSTAVLMSTLAFLLNILLLLLIPHPCGATNAVLRSKVRAR